MAKLPALQFYVGDWRKDPGVQSLSFHDRGVWFELLCLMHESEQRGRLVLNGKPMTEEQLSRLLGLDKQALTKTVHALYEAGVCSKCLTLGSLMCRRMVRDEEIRGKRQSAGKLGGNPAVCGECNEPGFVYLAKRESDGFIKIGASKQPEKRLYCIRQKFAGTFIHLIGKFYTEDMGRTESELLAKMGELAKRDGEWLELSQDDIDLCKKTLGISAESYISHPKIPVDLPVKRKTKRNHEVEDEEEEEEGTEKIDEIALFEIFWEEYPIKSGKKPARAAYEKAISRLEPGIGTVPAHEKLQRAAQDYQRFLKSCPNPPRAKYAQGWINDERYEDDYDDLLAQAMIRGHDPRGNLLLLNGLDTEGSKNGF